MRHCRLSYDRSLTNIIALPHTTRRSKEYSLQNEVYPCSLFPEMKISGLYSSLKRVCMCSHCPRLNLKTSDAQRARLRYTDYFGTPNRKLTIANHTLVLLDAPGLVEEDYQRAQSLKQYDEWKPIKSGPVEFVKSLQARDTGQCYC